MFWFQFQFFQTFIVFLWSAKRCFERKLRQLRKKTLEKKQWCRCFPVKTKSKSLNRNTWILRFPCPKWVAFSCRRARGYLKYPNLRGKYILVRRIFSTFFGPQIEVLTQAKFSPLLIFPKRGFFPTKMTDFQALPEHQRP